MKEMPVATLADAMARDDQHDQIRRLFGEPNTGEPRPSSIAFRVWYDEWKKNNSVR